MVVDVIVEGMGDPAALGLAQCAPALDVQSLFPE